MSKLHSETLKNNNNGLYYDLNENAFNVPLTSKRKAKISSENGLVLGSLGVGISCSEEFINGACDGK